MYPASMFHGVFRVLMLLFEILLGHIVAFNQRKRSTRTDAFGRRYIRAEFELLVFIRLIGSTRSLKDVDDGVHMGKETIRRYFENFCHGIFQLYRPAYLNRRPPKA